MPRGYHHLTYPERCQIFALKSSGESIAQIATILSVSRWTVYRELDRNQENARYHYNRAHIQALERRSKASSRLRKMTPEMVVLIEERLCWQWSPEQISGRLELYEQYEKLLELPELE